VPDPNQDAAGQPAGQPRRTALKVAAGLASAPLGAAVLAGCFGGSKSSGDGGDVAPAPDLGKAPALDAELPTDVTRTFIGPQFWANRLHDWQLAKGRIECLKSGVARTVALLPYSVKGPHGSVSASVRTGQLAQGDGYSGFLVGAGTGRLDPLAAALTQGLSGEAGGYICGYESDGVARIRDHSAEQNQRELAVLAEGKASGGPRATDEDVLLTLDLLALGTDQVRIQLKATSNSSGATLSAVQHDVAAATVDGGLLLASGGRRSPARHWFAQVKVAGDRLDPAVAKLAVGPIIGTLFAVNTAPVTSSTGLDAGSAAGSGGAGGRAVLTMTAVMAPLGDSDPQLVELQVRRSDADSWTTRHQVRMGGAFTAAFRVPDWDASVDWRYQVRYVDRAKAEHVWAGTVPADPAGKRASTIAMVNCTIHTGRPFDSPSRRESKLPGGQPVGLFTPANLYFPYPTVAAAIAAAKPDLLVGSGGQYYESHPTAQPKGESDDLLVLDVLYRFSLWMLSFRELTRSTPCVLQVDDHDMMQGNLYGWSGQAAPNGDLHYGGYVKPAAVVNAIQRLQCGHNPDPWDPTPVQQGITVYYGHFRWAGVSFAVLEDRKFKDNDQVGKSATGQPLTAATRQLLGPRQEQFLATWAGLDPGLPHVALTQTLWGGATTTVDGKPFGDSDNNGAVPAGRDRALRLVKQARGILLAGDTHFASLVRHGITTFTDGPLQFTGPAAGSLWQRWFTPDHALANPEATPHTGDWTDAFGNTMHVLAVAPPKVDYPTFRRSSPKGNDLADRTLKQEGFGLVRVDHEGHRYVLECWPWDGKPGATSGQFPGWPYELPFDQV
jgi:alkaline phosphatase D